MSKPRFDSGPDVPQAVLDALATVANVLMWLGGMAAILCLGLMFALGTTFDNSPDKIQAALANVDLLRKILGASLLGFGIGSAVTWWSEPKLPIVHIVVSILIIFAPEYVPILLGSATNEKPVMVAVLQSMQGAGIIFGVIATIVVLVDMFLRAKERLSVGMKADTLKFGKGIKEAGAQNRFMGKCFQLPYCRKFVRERCPIYHAKKACWREKVGCMCEEEVIRGAMEGRTIPKDSVAAAKYIPRNDKLSFRQKVARCRQCVIYNEHQKHKYKLWLIITNVSFLVIAVVGWSTLSGWSSYMLHSMDRLYAQMTFQNAHLGDFLTKSEIPFEPALIGVMLLMAFTYALKLLEYLVFKLKI